MPGLTLLSLGLSLAVLWGTLGGGHSERHSLMYIYTALSGPVENPGIHQFTAVGLLDWRMIDYFDSDHQVKVPKQRWMEENFKEDYWADGTKTRKKKQQWYNVNLKILEKRMNQTDQKLHVLQGIHGCEVDLLPDGKLSFQRGIDMYSYDGHTFLYFDDAHSLWFAAAKEAEPTVRKYNEIQLLKDHTKGYLEKRCPGFLQETLPFSKKQLLLQAPPEVYLFASPARHKENVFLTCMATGFYPPDIILTLTRDGRPLGELDGVTTTGLRPNNDDTFQRRDRIEILRSDRGLFACEVVHVATNINKRVVWDGKLPDDGEEGGLPLGPVLGALLPLVALVAGIVVFVVWFTKQKKQPSQETRLELQVDQRQVRVSDDGIAPTRDNDSCNSSDSAIGSSGYSGSRSSSEGQGLLHGYGESGGSNEDQGLLHGSGESGGSNEDRGLLHGSGESVESSEGQGLLHGSGESGGSNEDRGLLHGSGESSEDRGLLHGSGESSEDRGLLHGSGESGESSKDRGLLHGSGGSTESV